MTDDAKMAVQAMMPARTQQSAQQLAQMQQTGQLTRSWWLVPEVWDMLERMCSRFAASKLVPQQFQGEPASVFVALATGLPLGLSPLACLKSIAVINGRPTLWGDAPVAMILQHPSLVSIDEKATGTIAGLDRCWTVSIQRKLPSGQVRTVERSYSVDDAKLAKLWGKTGREGQPTPWVTSPDRMLYNRARAFTIRDAFADVLEGVSLAADLYEDGDADMKPAEFTVREVPPAAPAAEPDTVSTGDGFEPEAPRKRKARHTKKRPKTGRVGDTWGEGLELQVCIAIDDSSGAETWIRCEDITGDQAAEVFAIVHPHAELAPFVDPDFQVKDAGEADAEEPEAETPEPAAEAPQVDQVAAARADRDWSLDSSTVVLFGFEWEPDDPEKGALRFAVGKPIEQWTGDRWRVFGDQTAAVVFVKMTLRRRLNDHFKAAKLTKDAAYTQVAQVLGLTAKPASLDELTPDQLLEVARNVESES
jgi:hypothetical protein